MIWSDGYYFFCGLSRNKEENFCIDFIHSGEGLGNCQSFLPVSKLELHLRQVEYFEYKLLTEHSNQILKTKGSNPNTLKKIIWITNSKSSKKKVIRIINNANLKLLDWNLDLNCQEFKLSLFLTAQNFIWTYKTDENSLHNDKLNRHTNTY